MNDDKQTRMAFTLWQNMASLEKMLWNRYYKKFLQLLLDTKQDEDRNDDSYKF